MNALTAPEIQQRLPLRVEDFLLLNEAGAFADYKKTELIEGEIFYVNAQFNWHSYVQSRLAVALANALAAMDSHLHMLVEAAIDMRPHSMPEPDITLTDAPFVDGPIPLDTVALIVEIANSTLDFDLKRRAKLYGRHGVAEYWVADVRGRRLHRHIAPGPDGYATRDETAFGLPFASTTIAGLAVTIDIPSG